MDEFEKLKFEGDNHSYGYFKTHKLQNNQTVFICFSRFEFSKCNEYTIFLAIANKKKHIRQFVLGEKDILSDKETGRCGLEGLLWAKKQIIEFEKSDYCKDGDVISITWTDNRRRNIYEHGLRKIGFIMGYRDSRKCLYKKIHKEKNKNMLNTKCPICDDLFDSMEVKVKRTEPYEGMDILVFDCPCCGEEISDIECEGV